MLKNGLLVLSIPCTMVNLRDYGVDPQQVKPAPVK
jgi:hypothetical protein